MQADGFPHRTGHPSRPIEGPAEFSQWVSGLRTCTVGRAVRLQMHGGWKYQDAFFGSSPTLTLHGCPPYILDWLGGFLVSACVTRSIAGHVAGESNAIP